MKKFTIQDVQSYLKENDIEHECELLSTAYVSTKEKLEFRCNICGEKFLRSFQDVKRNTNFSCTRCSRGRNLRIEDVKNFLLEHDTNHDCQLLSTQYSNYYKPLEFKCNLCGSNFKRTMAQVKNIQNYCCPSCGKKAGGKNNALNFFQVQEYLKQYDTNHDCQLLSTNYVNNQTPMLFRCNKCGNNFSRTFATIKSKQAFTCFRCAHHFPLEPSSDIYKYNTNFLRSKLQAWKKHYLEQFPNCDITGSNEDLEVHHLISFHILLSQACENTNILLVDKISNMPKRDVDRLVSELLYLHESTEAVVLTKKIHQLFHQQYGYRNNIPDQYYAFKKQMLGGTKIGTIKTD